MTPSDLLDRAKEFFTVLYHNEPGKLRNLVRNTLGVFHENAGLISRVTSPKEDLTVSEITLPGDFGSVAMLRDARGQFHEYGIDEGVLTPVLQEISETPFTLGYFVNLRGVDVALSLEDYDPETPEYTAGDSAVRNASGEQFICIANHDPAGLPEPSGASFDDSLWKPYNHLPVECIGIMLDYLVASIDLHNTERARGVNASVGLQEELPNRSDLAERMKMIQERMAEEFGILPVCSVRG